MIKTCLSAIPIFCSVIAHAITIDANCPPEYRESALNLVRSVQSGATREIDALIAQSDVATRKYIFGPILFDDHDKLQERSFTIWRIAENKQDVEMFHYLWSLSFSSSEILASVLTAQDGQPSPLQHALQGNRIVSLQYLFACARSSKTLESIVFAGVKAKPEMDHGSLAGSVAKLIWGTRLLAAL